jgi:tetratricopeptide (TPR) repeat protein
MTGWLFLVTALLIVTVLPVNALAGEPATEPSTIAHELFDQGRASMRQKEYARACKKFEESQRLDPGGGTLLNLALCYELSGRTASAWGQFREALSQARREQRADRVEFAERHITALDPRLSRLRVVVPPETRAQRPVVRLNGVLLGESAWDEALAVDPGQQTIEASAANKLTARLQVRVEPDGDSQTLVVLPLQPRPAIEKRSSSGAAGHRKWGKAEFSALALGGLGLASTVVGGYFGVRAIDRNSNANDLCPNSGRCDPSGLELSRRAVRDGNLSTAFITAGIILAATGSFLYVTAPSPANSRQRGVTLGLAAAF